MGLLDKPRVAVLYGGTSSERKVSLRSGAAVAAALRMAGYPVTLMDTRDVSPTELDPALLDVCFIALHGTFGEDGGIQSLLEEMGIPYTGSGVEASRAAMDKFLTKECFGRAGVRTPPYERLDSRVPFEHQVAAVRAVRLPAIVKPAAEGSSVGLSKVDREGQLRRALAKALRFDGRALAEEYIAGRELTVGILDDRPLPIIEMLFQGPVFTWKIKYTPGAARHEINPTLPPGVADEVRRLALAAHRSLGCRGCTRVDLRLDEANVPWVLEVNTIPGMTEVSLIPDAAKAAGILFPRLCEMIVEMALRDRASGGARAAAAQSVGVL